MNNKEKNINSIQDYGISAEEAAKNLNKIVESFKVSFIEVVSKNLYQDLPPLDFVIRTSGEKRISNFMIYQSSYAEYDFPDTYFPDFDSKCLEESLDNYRKRDRRFGNAK